MVYTIGSVARLLEKSLETIRNLEERGIITPVRDSSKRRLYSEKDVEKLKAYFSGLSHDKNP